mgnify:CR=1 FL=1
MNIDGIGLQVALLRELGERGDRAPKVICCTHFHGALITLIFALLKYFRNH